MLWFLMVQTADGRFMTTLWNKSVTVQGVECPVIPLAFVDQAIRMLPSSDATPTSPLVGRDSTPAFLDCGKGRMATIRLPCDEAASWGLVPRGNKAKVVYITAPYVSGFVANGMVPCSLTTPVPTW